MLDWLLAITLTVEMFSFGQSPDEITTTLIFEEPVEACLMGSYNLCEGDMCFNPPEGTMAVVVRTLESRKRSVFLFLGRDLEDELDTALNRYYAYGEYETCTTKDAGDPIGFRVRLGETNSHNILLD